MPYEQRDMSGSLFKNKRKEKEKHPDTQGSCQIDGVDYWISGWTKTTQAGEKWVSLEFKRKDQQQEAAQPTTDKQKAAKAVSDLDSDIPFAPIPKGYS